ncbi:MAG: hypothetical protein ACT4NT_00505 [Nitrososphaerota archaeon]
MILTHKGIVAHRLELTPIKWAGDGYRKEQIKKMASIPPDTTLCVGRGTKSIKLADYPRIEKTIFLKRIVLSTERGTGTRIL